MKIGELQTLRFGSETAKRAKKVFIWLFHFLPKALLRNFQFSTIICHFITAVIASTIHRFNVAVNPAVQLAVFSQLATCGS